MRFLHPRYSTARHVLGEDCPNRSVGRYGAIWLDTALQACALIQAFLIDSLFWGRFLSLPARQSRERIDEDLPVGSAGEGCRRDRLCGSRSYPASAHFGLAAQ